jgi:hypothetical protein
MKKISLVTVAITALLAAPAMAADLARPVYATNAVRLVLVPPSDTASERSIMSFLEKMKTAEAELAARDSDPWRPPLERVRGNTGDDGIERVTTQTVFDVLEIPQRNRRAGACRRLAKLMTELGWTAVRVRGMTRGACLEQVRGYARDARHRSSPSGSRPRHPLSA